MTIKTRTSGIMIPAYVAASGFTPTCQEAADFLTRAANVVSNTDKQNYNDLICGLKSDGVLAKLDCLYIFAAIDQTTAKLNLISASFPCLENGTPNFTAYTGYQGNGTDFYLDTQFAPDTAGGNFAIHSASFGAYDLSSTGGGADSKVTIGNTRSNGLSVSRIYPNFVDGNCYSGINDDVVTAFAMASSNGFTIISLLSGTTTTYNYSSSNGINGAGNNNPVDTAASTPDRTFSIFGHRQSDNSVTNLTSDELSAAFIGGGLSDPEVTKLKNRIGTYMNAYGIGQYSVP